MRTAFPSLNNSSVAGSNTFTFDSNNRYAYAITELQTNLDDSKARLAPRCPECGGIGTLEEIDGALRCIDCDETVAATSKLSGFGRR